MATFNVGVPDGLGNIIGAGSLPACALNRGMERRVGRQPRSRVLVFFQPAAVAWFVRIQDLNANIDAAGNVVSVTFRYLAEGGGLIPVQFVATGLSIPKDVFLANKADVMALILAGNDSIIGNDFDNILHGGAGQRPIHGPWRQRHALWRRRRRLAGWRRGRGPARRRRWHRTLLHMAADALNGVT